MNDLMAESGKVTHEEEESVADVYLQAKFVSERDEIKSVLPNRPFSIADQSDQDGLNRILKAAIESADGKGADEFDFLIESTLLRVSLREFVDQRQLNTENVLQIECVRREPGPTPDQSIPHDDWVSCVRGLNKNLIFSTTYDGSLTIWERKSGENGQFAKVQSVKRHEDAVKALELLSRPTQTPAVVQLVTASNDETILLWEFDKTKKLIEVRRSLKGHERSVECLSANQDGDRLLSGGFDTFLKIWDTSNDPKEIVTTATAAGGGDDELDGEKSAKRRRKEQEERLVVQTPMVTLSGHRDAIVDVEFSALSQWTEAVTASADHTLVLWDLELNGQKGSLSGNRAFTSLSVCRFNGLVVTGSVDRLVRLWDMRSREGSMVKQAFQSHGGWVSSVNWSPTRDNLFLSGSYDKTVKLWDTRSNKAPLFDLTGHADRVLCTDWSVDSLILSGSVDCTIKSFVRQVD